MKNKERQYTTKETIAHCDGSHIQYMWHPFLIPKNITATQVYGFFITEDNLVCLVRDKDENFFTPVGGGIEKNETPKSAFIRESKEEAQIVPVDIILLGSLEVIVTDKQGNTKEHCLQVRYICKAKNIKKFVPLKNGFEIIERIFIFYKDLPDFVKYMEKYKTGMIQYSMIVDYIEGEIAL